MLFIDYGSAFNTIIPSELDTKLRSLGLDQRSLLRGERLITMARTEQMEWHQTPGNHLMVDVVDTIPLFALQS
jgi:hypothetical protein